MKPPPFISTADPDSFARRTIRVRKPAILASVREAHDLPAGIVAQLENLRESLAEGRLIESFALFAHDPGLFAPAELAAWRGALAGCGERGWLDLPWYFAESYFYVSLLLAFGYYDPEAPTFRQDPFAPFKQRELSGPGGGLELAGGVLARTNEPAGAAERLRALLYFCLWGNRVDLSNIDIAEDMRGRVLAPHDPESGHLLYDESPRVVAALLGARRVDFVLDNCGAELVCDLILALSLLEEAGVEHVILHLKQAPFFVSDATAEDLEQTLAALSAESAPAVRRAGKRLQALRGEGRLALADHYFWNGPLHFPDLPDALRSELSDSDLVVLKGDANYRRLVSDRRWPASARLAEIAAYFPAPLTCLRTLKSELTLDLSKKRVAALDAADPEWRVNGRRGIIRWLPRPAPQANAEPAYSP